MSDIITQKHKIPFSLHTLLCAGNNIIEIGANWIHGPSEENPVFCLAREYGLLEPEALLPENQAMDIEGHPPWVPNWFSSSGNDKLFLVGHFFYNVCVAFVSLMTNMQATICSAICVWPTFQSDRFPAALARAEANHNRLSYMG